MPLIARRLMANPRAQTPDLGRSLPLSSMNACSATVPFPSLCGRQPAAGAELRAGERLSPVGLYGKHNIVDNTEDGTQIPTRTGAPGSHRVPSRLASERRRLGQPDALLPGEGLLVIAHDRRGHGRSAQASDGHDLDHYAADAAAVVEGEFKWSSQHLDGGVCDGHAETAFGSVGGEACCARQAGQGWRGVRTGGGSGRRSRRVCRVRTRRLARGCRRRWGHAGSGRRAACHQRRLRRVEAALGAVSVVRGTGGDRAVAGAGPRGARDRPPAGAGGIDDLPGAAAQRRHARRRSGVSGHHRAVARRAGGAPSEAGEAGGQRGAAELRAGPAGRRGRRPGRGRGPGPVVPWKGRRHGRRQDRRWARAWSPEQIAQRLRLDFPDDETMRISHEAIYQALYVQGRGALRRELTACLRTGRALRVPRARSRGRGKSFIAPEIMISQRPAEAADRAVPGHWEGGPHPGAGQLGDRHPGGAHDAVHDAAAPAPHGGPRLRTPA